MFRLALQYVLAFALPFIGFFGYRLLVGRGRDFLRDTPWYVLTVAGLVIVSFSIVFLALKADDPVDGVYIPPHVEDGKIVPGRVIPGGEKADDGG